MKAFYLNSFTAAVAAVMLLASAPVTASSGTRSVEVPGKAAMAADLAKAILFSEFSDASLSVPGLKFPLTGVNGKFKLGDGFTQFETVRFKLLGSEFAGAGRVAKGSGTHDFRVSSSAVSFDDLKKLIPALAPFGMKGDLKFNCAVSGPAGSPVVDADLDLSGADLDFSSLRPELKGIGVSGVRMKVVFSGGKYDIKSLSFNALGGRAEVSGLFDPDKTSETALDFRGVNIDAAMAASYFPRLAGKISGAFETGVRIKNPADPAAMVIEGKLAMKNGFLKDFDFIRKLSDRIKVPLEKIDYDLIGGDFTISARGKKINFRDFKISSKMVKFNATGTVDEEKDVVDAIVRAEAEGGSMGGVRNKKLAAILKKAVSRVKLNFVVSGTAGDPKIELDLGQKR